MPAGGSNRRRRPPSLWPLWMAVGASFLFMLALWIMTTADRVPTP